MKAQVITEPRTPTEPWLDAKEMCDTQGGFTLFGLQGIEIDCCSECRAAGGAS